MEKHQSFSESQGSPHFLRAAVGRRNQSLNEQHRNGNPARISEEVCEYCLV